MRLLFQIVSKRVRISKEFSKCSQCVSVAYTLGVSNHFDIRVLKHFVLKNLYLEIDKIHMFYCLFIAEKLKSRLILLIFFGRIFEKKMFDTPKT